MDFREVEEKVHPGIGSHTKLGKEHVKAIYCHPACLTYMQSAGWMTQKLESRLPGEISVSSDRHMTPPLWQKAKN